MTLSRTLLTCFRTLSFLCCLLSAAYAQLPDRSPRLYTYLSDNIAHVDTAPPPAAAINRQMIVKTMSGAGARTNSSLQLNVVASPSGCGYYNGSVSLLASGGTPPYLYNFNGAGFQGASVFVAKGPGSYPVAVQDAMGQVVSTTATVTNNFPPASVYVSGSVLPSACSAGDGSLTLTASGGVPPYEYSLDLVNFQPGNQFTHLPSGMYMVYVRDANGCIGTSIGVYFLLSGACGSYGGSWATQTCGSDAFISMSVFAGTPPYQYSLDGGPFQSSPDFRNIGVGMHQWQATDAAGKQYYLTFNVAHACYPKLNVSKADATCGNHDGSIAATTTSGTQPYQYSLDGVNFQSSNVFSNLAAGTYTVVSKDAAGYLNVAVTVLYDGCPPSVTAVADNTTCGYHNGRITATASGGAGGYSYSIDGINFQGSNVFTGLASGSYTVTIKDAAGATATTTVAIADTPMPAVSATVQPAACDLSGGSMTITAGSGTPPYQYSIDGINYQAGNVFSLSPGPYTAYVKDASGCAVLQGVYWINVLCTQLSLAGHDASCSANDGSIVATATSGTAPYQYSIDGISFQSSNSFINLPPGHYTITARDAAGVMGTRSIDLGRVCMYIVAVPGSATCGNSNGSATVAISSMSNGTQPFLFSMDGVHFQSDNTFTGLAPGAYTFTIKDANGFTATTTATIAGKPGPQAATAAATAAGCADNDGSITVSANGGTAPLQYSIDGSHYQGSGSFTGIASGSYTATIQDANGCIASAPVVVALRNTLQLDAGPPITICEGVAGHALPGSNGKSFSWTPATGLSDASILTPIVAPAVTTLYSLTAYWGACQKTVLVTVTVNPAPVADAGTADTICFGQSAQLQGSGGNDYTWWPATYLDNPWASAPVAGRPDHSITYHLSVADASGCRSLNDATVNIVVTPPAKVYAGKDTSIYRGQPVQLNAVDINNSGFSHYSWSPAAGLDNATIQNPVASVSQTTTFTVRASTPAGCEGVASISIKAYAAADIFVPNSFTPNHDGHNDLFRAIPIGIRSFSYLAVFDRWGHRIFYSVNPTQGWDGTLGGRPQDPGAYVWIAAGIDYKGALIERKGTVLLLR